MAKSRARSRLLNTLQIKNDYTEPPAGLKWRSNTFFIIATVAIGLFTDLFLYGLVVPILPYMLQDRVGLPEEQVQSWVSALLAIYAASSVCISPVAGILADRLSTRQAPFLFGLLALLAATVLLFVGRSLPVLVLARIFQGISAGFVWTIGLALCLETVGPDNLGKTIGSIFSFVSVGSLSAPILGGVLYEKTGYAGVFGIGAGILVVDLVMRLLVIEKKVARRYDAEDPSTVSEAPNSQQDGASEDPEHQSSSETSPLLDNADRKENSPYKFSSNLPRIAHYIPILPCLADPALLTALLVASIQALLLGSFDSTIPTLAQELFHFSSLRAGLLFLPLGACDFFLGPLFGWCVDRFGTKPVAVIAYLYLVPVLVLLRLPHEGGKDQIALYAALLGLCGVGLAGIGAPGIVEAGAVVQKYYEANPEWLGSNGPYAQLYGLTNMVFSLGLTVGPELAGELKRRIGYGNMNAALAAVCGVTSLACWLFVGGRPRVLGGRREG